MIPVLKFLRIFAKYSKDPKPEPEPKPDPYRIIIYASGSGSTRQRETVAEEAKEIKYGRPERCSLNL